MFPVTHKDLLLCELMSFGCLSDSDHSTHKEPVFTHSGGKPSFWGKKGRRQISVTTPSPNSERHPS